MNESFSITSSDSDNMAHDLRDKFNCDNVDDLEIEARDLEIKITNFVSTMKAKMEAARAERKGGKLCQL